MTRNQIFSNYLLYISSTYTDATYIFYESHLRCFYNYFKEDEITTENLLKYITYSRKHNISNATINKRILAVKRAYKYNNLSHLVLENYKKLKETNKHITWSSLQDWFFTACAIGEDYLKHDNEVETYDEFINSLYKTRNVRESLINIGLIRGNE